MKTEAEAKKCWCPFARAVPGKQRSIGADWDAVPAANRISLEPSGIAWPGGAQCIASECMAWRWEQGASWDAKRNMMVTDMMPHGVGASRGYCGLAGKP